MDLQSLRTVLAPLTAFGADEFTFDVEGTEVTLRALLPWEEVAVQEHSALVVADSTEEGEDSDILSRATAVHFFDKFRIEVISYALVQIGDTDLRNMKTVETGEKLDNGVAVKVTKQVALRKIITESWSRGMITITFSKLGDLVSQIAEKADKVARESVADLDAEISRLDNRLVALREERERRAAGDPSITTKQIKALVTAGEALAREVDEAIDSTRADRLAADAIRDAAVAEAYANEGDPEPAPEPAPEPPAPRESVIPRVAPPPSAKANPPFVSSFADPDEDPQALVGEADRIAVAQRAAAEASKKSLGDPLSEAEQVASVRGPDGKPIPAYKLPTATLSGRGRGGERSKGDIKGPSADEVDPDPRKGSVNPNFKPPGR